MCGEKAMNDSEKSAVVEAILTRAAEEAGDITQVTMGRFYERFPPGRELFTHHGGEGVENLEGEMVQRSVHCLMYWYDSPGEIEMLLMGSVPHHSETLNVPAEFYQGLLTATAEIILETIPAENSEELAVWQELSDELRAMIQRSKECAS